MLQQFVKKIACLWIDTKKIFSLEANGVSDQNNVRRWVNQGQKMLSFGYVILHLKALSLCFLYAKIKRENKVIEDSCFSAVKRLLGRP